MSETNDLQDEIHQLVHQNPVVLFMKGTPTFPRCGFSATVAHILKQCGLKNYVAVDVLTRPDIKTELKQYSDWPTFPQLFVSGELVGGSDITREMYEAGELQPLLQSAANLANA